MRTTRMNQSEVQWAGDTFKLLHENISRVMKGQSENIRYILAGLVGGGHILLEDKPGTGKTTLAKIIKGALDISDGELDFGQNIFYSYYAQNQTDLIDPKKTVLEVAENAAPPELRTKVRSILGAFLFSGEGLLIYFSAALIAFLGLLSSGYFSSNNFNTCLAA